MRIPGKSLQDPQEILLENADSDMRTFLSESIGHEIRIGRESHQNTEEILTEQLGSLLARHRKSLQSL